MSSSSSNPPTPPPLNLQSDQLGPTNIPPDPGNSCHVPLTSSSVPSNGLSTSQNDYEIVTFRQVLSYWCGNVNRVNQTIASPNPPQIWFAQHVYPLVTPMRIFWFSLSLISFLLAYRFFMETEFYKSSIGAAGHHHARPLLFFVAVNIGHIVWLIFLLFFSFCSPAYERYRHHYMLKSLGELIVKLVVSLLILGIGHRHPEVPHGGAAPVGSPAGELEFSEVAELVTFAFLTINALCVINLLKPGHHYYLLDATASLTLHLGLVGERIYRSISAVVFVFLILAIKNFLWRHKGHAQAPTNQHRHLARITVEV